MRRENVRSAAAVKLEESFRPRDLILARVRHTIRAAAAAPSISEASAIAPDDGGEDEEDDEGVGEDVVMQEEEVAAQGTQDAPKKGSSPARQNRARNGGANGAAAAPNLSATSLRGGAVVLLSTAENELGVVHAVSEVAGFLTLMIASRYTVLIKLKTLISLYEYLMITASAIVHQLLFQSLPIGNCCCTIQHGRK